MGAQNTKLVREIVRDSKDLIRARAGGGNGAGTLDQLVGRRQALEAEIKAVQAHKAELLARRNAAVQGIVRDYEARRQRAVEQLQSQQPLPATAAAAASAGAAVVSGGGGGSSGKGPGLPSPESLARRVEELRRGQEEAAVAAAAATGEAEGRKA